MRRFYLDHQSRTASPLETQETFIKNTEAAGSEVFLRLFPMGEQRETRVSTVKKFEDPQRQI